MSCLAEKSTETEDSKREGGSGSPAHIYVHTDTRIEREGVTVQLLCRAAGSRSRPSRGRMKMELRFATMSTIR